MTVGAPRGLLVTVAVGQKREEARVLHGRRQLALIARLRARDAARHDLAGLGDVLAQHVEILVVDLDDALGREAAELLAAEELGHFVLLRKTGADRLLGGVFAAVAAGSSFFARRPRFAVAARTRHVVVVSAEAEAFVVAAAAIALVVLVLHDRGHLGDRVLALDD